MKASTLSIVLGLVASAAAWGTFGHRTVGYLAQLYFTPEATQWVESIIHPNDNFDISDAAIWADRVRQARKYTAPWHFVDAQDNPPESCGLHFDRDCQRNKGCVISAIVNQTAILQDSSLDAVVRQDALKYILHFMGDVHQPLHTEAIDRGGTQIQVCFDHKCAHNINLHEVWDTEILLKLNDLKRGLAKEDEKVAAQQWAHQLFSAPQTAGLREDVLSDCPASDPQQCVIDYATESNALICSYVLAKGVDWLENNDLGGEYYDGATGIVQQQIARAGQRLGAWVNGLAAGQKPLALVEQKVYL